MIAQNAQPIVAARLRGMKPSEMIRVSLVGTLCAGNHQVHALPDTAHDWRWACDLDVCVYAKSTDDWYATLKQVAHARPEFLSLWFTDLHAGSKVYLIPTSDDIARCRPVPKWEYELDFLPWLDFQNQEFAQCN